jgi:hypothetical protein
MRDNGFTVCGRLTDEYRCLRGERPDRREVCRQALADGHHITAVWHDPKAFPLKDDSMLVAASRCPPPIVASTHNW